MSWTGAAADPLRDARVPAPPTRPRARVVEQRGIERPRSVDLHPDRAGEPEDVVPRDRNEVLSRVLNVLIAGIGLLLAMPLMFLASALIKVSSRGPILYRQTRVGLDRRWKRTLAIREARMEDLGGQVFTIYKLRTMRVDAEKASGAVWATENDPRVTRLGRVLRRYRIDEVPQLWNVLRGDMNIVGPRPERPSIVARLREDIPEYRFRHRVKPGLTGLAQINQNYDACLDDVRSKVNWDLRYIREQGFWMDIRIMVQTVPSVLLKFQGW
jgi:lipopolysaccharide/colanic/teichoic acid biosynthesis glycosyltransferase